MELRPEAGAQLHSQLCVGAQAAADLKSLAAGPHDGGAPPKQQQDPLHAAMSHDPLMQLPGAAVPLNGHAAAGGVPGDRNPFAVAPGGWDSGSGEFARRRRLSMGAAVEGGSGAALWDIEQGQQQEGGLAQQQRPGGSLESIPERHNGHHATASAPNLAQAGAHAGGAGQISKEEGDSSMRSHSLPGPIYIPGSVFRGVPSPARSALPTSARRGTAVQPPGGSQQSGAATNRVSQNPLRRLMWGQGRPREEGSASSGPRQSAAAADASAEQQQEAGGAQSNPSSWFFSRNASFKAPDNPWG